MEKAGDGKEWVKLGRGRAEHWEDQAQEGAGMEADATTKFYAPSHTRKLSTVLYLLNSRHRSIGASGVLHGVKEQTFPYPKETLVAALAMKDTAVAISVQLFCSVPEQLSFGQYLRLILQLAS